MEMLVTTAWLELLTTAMACLYSQSDERFIGAGLGSATAKVPGALAQARPSNGCQTGMAAFDQVRHAVPPVPPVPHHAHLDQRVTDLFCTSVEQTIAVEPIGRDEDIYQGQVSKRWVSLKDHYTSFEIEFPMKPKFETSRSWGQSPQRLHH